LQRETARKQIIHDPEAGGTVGDTSDTLNRLAPVLYQLHPGCKHDPDVDTLERNRIIHDGFPDEVLTSYKMLRTRVLQQLNAREWKTMAITAANDGAGKTVTAINLAIALAMHGGHEIFLVDLDMRNPSIAEYFGLPTGRRGLAAYLDDKSDLSNILWDVGIENLAVLASRDRIANSSEHLTSKRMRHLITSFESASPKPIIIFDLPPVLAADDAVAVSPFIDGMLVVVSEGGTTRDNLNQALDMLRDANIIGLVLNKAGHR
jgi:capsular exopolysaccharide synthesis family protein